MYSIGNQRQAAGKDPSRDLDESQDDVCPNGYCNPFMLGFRWNVN